MHKIIATIFSFLPCFVSGAAIAADPDVVTIARYIQPYADTNNFSGAVLISKGGKVVFEKAYGVADIEAKRLNTASTRFHIASMSMQFTAATVMRLVDQGKLSLDTTVDAIVPNIPNGDKITIRELLEETSGLPDVNGFPDYDKILQQHQTAQSLVQYIHGKPPAGEPGGASKGEEHSAYNLLALIAEKKTGLSFARAVSQLVFKPLGMNDSGVDDDAPLPGDVAHGYAPDGTSAIVPAKGIRWSAKTGNASVYSSVGDEGRWIDALFQNRFLSAQSRQTMLDYSKAHVGYGWFKNVSKRFGVPIYYMNGRAPGFASFLIHVPSQDLTVIVLSNIYASVSTTIGLNLTAMMLGQPYEPATLLAAPPDIRPFDKAPVRFRFGPDFYQHNAVLTARAEGGQLFLDWPDGSNSPLIPAGQDSYIDRAYWVPVQILRDARGDVSGLKYDAFNGSRSPSPNQNSAP